ncbi:MAG: AI-2E family transporter [Patescibacteria group bacterium]
MPRKIEVSHKTIVFTALFAILLWFVYFVRDIVMQIAVSLLIAAVLNPIVTQLSKIRIPRAVSILVIYIILLVIFGGAVALIITPLVNETTSFVNSMPEYLGKINLPFFASKELVGQITSQAGNLSTNLLKFVFSVFSNVLTILAIFIFSFYFLLSREKLDDFLSNLFGEEKAKRYSQVVDEWESRLGGWARGQLVLMIIIGVATYLGLTLLGLPFALPLALLAGILEIVPTLGPIVASIPAIVVGFGISPIVGVGVAALSFFLNQFENYVLVPKIMEKSVGLNPIITIIAIIVGFRVAGVAGAILAVPAVITFQVFALEANKPGSVSR